MEVLQASGSDRQRDVAPAILALLADGTPRPVREICEVLDLPRSTAVNALDRLARSGLVAERAAAVSGRGRPSRRWAVSSAPGPIAVLVGAAHGTTAGVVTAGGEVLGRVSSHDVHDGPAGREAPDDILDRALARAQVGAGDLELAVLGLPGASQFPQPSAPTPVGSHLRRLREWNGTPATEAVAARLGCPVHAENDANLAALGEAHHGAGRDSAIVLYASLAYGTGAGLVLNGRLHRGRTRLAGEIGHLHHDDSGRLCDCGGRGCFWHTTSIPALLVELAAAHGRDFTITDLAAAAADEELDVVRALLGFGHALGRRLADAVVFLDPDVIVVDGALGEASRVVTDGVRDAVRRYAPPSMTQGLRVEPGTLGVDAHLAGAAVLVRTERLLAPADAGR